MHTDPSLEQKQLAMINDATLGPRKLKKTPMFEDKETKYIF